MIEQLDEITDDEQDSAFDPLTFIPSNILFEIGRIAVAFSFLEDQLNEFVAVLLGAGPDGGQAVTFQIRNITDRIVLAKTLADLKIKSEERRAQAASLLADLREINDQRNILIHRAIVQVGYHVDPREHTVKYRRKDDRIRTPVETTLKGREFEKLTQDLLTLANKLIDVTHAHRLSVFRSAS